MGQVFPFNVLVRVVTLTNIYEQALIAKLLPFHVQGAALAETLLLLMGQDNVTAGFARCLLTPSIRAGGTQALEAKCGLGGAPLPPHSLGSTRGSS